MVDNEFFSEEVQKFPENIAMEDMEVTKNINDPCEEVRAPVRPRVPSDPVIGVTPVVEDERKRKRTHPQALDMEAVAPILDDQALDIVAPPSPIPPVFVQPPSPVPVTDVLHEDQQPAVFGQASSPRLELQPLVATPAEKPKKKIRRLGQGLVVDMEIQISSNIIKQGLEYYEDTLRCPSVAMDFAPSLQRHFDFKAPGRKVGNILTDDFKAAAQVRGLGQLVWDLDKVDNQEQERVNMEQQVSMNESEVNSRCGMRNTSELSLDAPQAESSRLSMDADQGMEQGLSSMDVDLVRDKQLDPIAEEVAVDTSRCPVNYDGGFIEEQIPDLQITEAHPVNENLDALRSPRNDQEVPLPHTINDQNLVLLSNQDSVVEAEPVPANSGILQDQVSCKHGDDLCRDASPSLPLSLPVPRDSVEMKLAGLLIETEYCYFSDICPPSTSNRREAAGTFFHLLQMEKERKIVTYQEEVYGPIKVKKL